jgi:signal transduction histidine kinase
MDNQFKGLEAVLAKVVHDLRTPLSVVHTTTNMLLNPKYRLTPEQVREQHERIRRNAELMNRMVGELGDLAQIGNGSLRLETGPVDVNELLREVAAANQESARGKGVELVCEAASEPALTEADRTRLLQLFQSLVGYAVKTAAAGGSVRVGGQRCDQAAEVEITASGSELSEEALRQVFEPWRDGAGLGLFIGKGIVEAHGGHIRCGAQPGVGTTFTVTLPLTH